MKLMLIEVNGLKTAAFVSSETESAQLLGATSVETVPVDSSGEELTELQKAHIREVMHGCLAAFGIRAAE